MNLTGSSKTVLGLTAVAAGCAAVAVLASPAARRAGLSVAKKMIKSGIKAYEHGRTIVDEFVEIVEDAHAEALAELTSDVQASNDERPDSSVGGPTA